MKAWSLLHAGPSTRVNTLTTVAAGAWGLLRNAFQEFPAFLWSGLNIDACCTHIPQTPPVDAFGSACSANLLATPRLLMRDTGQLQPTQQSGFHSLMQPAVMSLGTWVITGGMGGLGLLFASYTMLQLISSSIQLVDVAARALPEWLCLGTGGAVQVSRADCASHEEVHSCRRACGGPPVQGVMHAAGVLQDALLLKQTAASFRAVLSGKVGRCFSYLAFLLA